MIEHPPPPPQESPHHHHHQHHQHETKEESTAPSSAATASSSAGTATTTAAAGGGVPTHEARTRGLLRAMIAHFSSTPLDLSSSNNPATSTMTNNSITARSSNNHLDFSSSSFVIQSGTEQQQDGVSSSTATNSSSNRRHFSNSNNSSILTDSERGYLEGLLLAGNVTEIEKASQTLADAELFPPPASSSSHEEEEEEESSSSTSENNNEVNGEGEPTTGTDGVATSTSYSITPQKSNTTSNNKTVVARRDSRVQQQLFRLHEMTKDVPPSQVLQRMSLVHRNSLLDDNETNSVVTLDYNVNDDGDTANDTNVIVDAADWDPFQDVTSWLDGSQGVEVTDSRDAAIGTTATNTNVTGSNNKPPFKILGTSADDTSCHPHVLTPPLMESLLAFVPENMCCTDDTSNNTNNLWLKYSLVRDGGGLFELLRRVRASTFTILAIETTDGHVLGSFTSLPWRLSSGWYHANISSGQQEFSFLWRMRRSRCLDNYATSSSRSIVQQVCQESEIQVYPYRGGGGGDGTGSESAASGGSGTGAVASGGSSGDSYAVQYCSKRDGIRLGQKELVMPGKTLSGKHYGHALCLAPNLKSGTTSTSETFGNPCLLNGDLRGSRFEVANLEVWTLTPHDTVADAEQSELSNLFLDGGRRATQKLHMWNILVGQPI